MTTAQADHRKNSGTVDCPTKSSKPRLTVHLENIQRYSGGRQSLNKGLCFSHSPSKGQSAVKSRSRCTPPMAPRCLRPSPQQLPPGDTLSPTVRPCYARAHGAYDVVSDSHGTQGCIPCHGINGPGRWQPLALPPSAQSVSRPTIVQCNLDCTSLDTSNSTRLEELMSPCCDRCVEPRHASPLL